VLLWGLFTRLILELTAGKISRLWPILDIRTGSRNLTLLACRSHLMLRLHYYTTFAKLSVEFN
jgi:hypothetical protein